MLDTELLDRGAQAEQAKPYIGSVIQSAKELVLDRLINLPPDQTMMFTIYRSQLICFEDILTVVETDIRNSRTALARIQGDTDTQNQGIL